MSMWIEFDDSLIDSFPRANNYQCMTLDAIATSACAGRHVLFGSLAVLDWVQSQEIGIASRAICQKIKNNRSELKSLRSKVGRKIIIGAYPDAIKSDDNEIWHVSLNALLYNPFSAAVLLTENHVDANLYKLAATHYRMSIGVDASYRANLSVQGGGGNQIHPTFVNLVGEKCGFCLVVTDTDKDYPSALSSDTSRKCANLSSKREWIVAHLEVPARELENIIPFNLLSDSIYADGGAVDLHNGINQIESVGRVNVQMLLYGDLKKGTTRYWARGNHGNLEKKKYWNILANSKVGCTNPECDEHCNARSKDDCKCFLISSLGDGIADKFLEYSRTKGAHELFKRVKTSSNASQWLSIGKSVFEWGIALPVSRS